MLGMEPDDSDVSYESKNPVDVDIGDMNPLTQKMYGLLTRQMIHHLG